METMETVRQAIHEAHKQYRQPAFIRISKSMEMRLFTECRIIIKKDTRPRMVDELPPLEPAVYEMYGVPVDLTSLAPELLCEDGTRILIQS